MILIEVRWHYDDQLDRTIPLGQAAEELYRFHGGSVAGWTAKLLAGEEQHTTTQVYMLKKGDQ